jgi:hypothetical protein
MTRLTSDTVTAAQIEAELDALVEWQNSTDDDSTPKETSLTPEELDYIALMEYINSDAPF